MKIERIKDLIQSCHINFLLGSGISKPYLSALGNIEKLLTDLSKQSELKKEKYELIKASIYKLYFEKVMWPNIDGFDFLEFEVDPDEGTKEAYDIVLDNYKEFLTYLNEILLYRYSRILNKQINLFTTNIDLFIEKAVEETKHEFNDGFKGRLNPVYDLSNFQKSYSKTTLQYENKSEIPVFNILKVHGSLNWEKTITPDEIVHSDLSHIRKVQRSLENGKFKDSFLDITEDSTIEKLIQQIDKLEPPSFYHFLEAYEKILIINPTKEKFQRTLIDDKFYELLRLYANSLEKENSILFTLGFSFADEHIRDITLRAANSNPTLQIIVFAYDNKAKRSIKKELGIENQPARNSNITVISPSDLIASNCIDKKDKEKMERRISTFDFTAILNEIFKPVTELIRIKAES